MDEITWPDRYDRPSDLDVIETVPYAERGVPDTTLAAVERAERLWPSRIALSIMPCGEHWNEAVDLTYGELAASVRSYANALASLGVSRTDTVALVSPNTAQLIPALLGAQAVSIAAPVNPALREDHILHLLQAGNASVVVAAGPEIHPQLWAAAVAAAGLLRPKALLALRPTAAAGSAPQLDQVDGVTVAYLEDLAAAQPGDQLIGPPPAGSDLAGLFHTGGTTGVPKLAAHTHRMEMADAWAVGAMSELDDDSVLLAALPLFHVNAVVVTLLAQVLRGRRVVWAGPLGYRDPAFIGSFWRIVEHYRIAAMSAVPLVYSTLLSVPVDGDISSLRMCIVGAAPLPRAVTTAFHDHTGIQLVEGYGLTEATCASARSFAADPRPGSCGQRLPYQSVAAARQDPQTGAWSTLPPDEVGTIVIRGDVVFPGYVVAHDHDGPVLDTAGKVTDGWLDTGDVGSVSADGFITLRGRTKDLIIRGGHNIDPAVIEEALRSHPAVIDAGAVGSPDERAGEVPVAFVTVRDADVATDELIAWAAGRVSEPAAAPKAVFIVDALPVTAVGKPYKPELRLLAARWALRSQLESRGAVLVGDDWCADDGGSIRLAVPEPADAELRDSVAGLLDRYPFRWDFVV